MKKILALLVFIFALPLSGQVYNPSIVVVSSTPSGACSVNLPDRQVATTGALYTCQSGTWAQIGTGGSSFVTVLLPSGDTTGGTDGSAIQTACTNSSSVQLTSGNYYVGKSNAVITLAAPCRIVGVGEPTVITNVGTTNDIFRISYFTTWSEGPWVYPSSTNQSEIAWMQFAQQGTPTNGYVFDIGSGVPPSGGIFSYTMNVHIHDTVMNGMWGGAKLVDSELYAFIDHNMWRQFVGGGAIFYAAPLGSGDNHISDNEFSGLTNSGIIITQSDTTMFAHDKLNGSGITFTGAGGTKTVQFTDLSIETGITQPCAIDFGTGTAPTNIQFIASEQLGFTQLFCHPTNVTNFAFSLANSTATTDYVAGLISNNGYTTVSFPSLQDFASFAGTAGTLLSAYTTQFGKTFALYSNSGTSPTIPQLNGSSAAYLPSGTDSSYGDSLDSLTPASANYTVGITCTRGASGSPTMGVYARALSAANTNYILQYPVAATAIQLYKEVAGTATLLGSTNVSWAAGATHTLNITVNGTSISGNLDGTTTVGPFTDASVSAAGQAGLRLTGGGNVTCTNFYVQ